MTNTPQPDLQDFDLDGFIPYQLAVVAAKLSEELSRQYQDRFGISIPEWRVLIHVRAGGDISVRDVEARAAMERSKVSRAASRLEAKGLIAKRINDGDRRLLRLALTAEGEALMEELVPLAQAYQDEVTRRLGPALSGFEKGLGVLLETDPNAAK